MSTNYMILRVRANGLSLTIICETEYQVEFIGMHLDLYTVVPGTVQTTTANTCAWKFMNVWLFTLLPID